MTEMMLAKDLTEEEREVFAYEFYSSYYSPDDSHTEFPRGMPWLDEEDIYLMGYNVKDMASKYFIALLDNSAMSLIS